MPELESEEACEEASEAGDLLVVVEVLPQAQM